MHKSMSSRQVDVSSIRYHASRIALAYLLFGAIWIVASDTAVDLLVPDGFSTLLAQSFKGMLFVLGSTVLVYYLARHAATGLERKLVAEQLRTTEYLLETVLANLGEAVIWIDSSTRSIVDCNSAVKPIFGYEREELVGQSAEVLHIDRNAYDEFGRLSETAVNNKGVFRCQCQMKRRDGTPIITENTVIALNLGNALPMRRVSIVRDITERTRAEEALRDSEQRYRFLAENTLDVIWTVNTALEYTYVNPAIEQQTGYRPEEFVGTHVSDHFDDKSASELQDVIRREIAKGPGHQGLFIRTSKLRKDGTAVPVEIHGGVIFDENGRPTAIQGTTRDISEWLELEAGLRQAQKMEALGTMAAGLAHEVNNPVLVIQESANFIERAAEEDSKIRQFVGNIKRETARIHNIVNSLLGFARSEVETAPTSTRICDMVEVTLELSRILMRADQVIVRAAIPDTLPEVTCHSQ